MLRVGCGIERADDRSKSSEAALEVTQFGSNPGGLKMSLFAPSAPKPAAALVVAMHGCTQTAAEYEKAGWNKVAEANGFYVLYPEVQGGHPIDASRIFVTGLSAGGGMTAAMLGSYPDVFSAGAIMSGLPYRCADSQSNASGCQQGKDLSLQARRPFRVVQLSALHRAHRNRGPWPIQRQLARSHRPPRSLLSGREAARRVPDHRPHRSRHRRPDQPGPRAPRDRQQLSRLGPRRCARQRWRCCDAESDLDPGHPRTRRVVADRSGRNEERLPGEDLRACGKPPRLVREVWIQLQEVQVFRVQ